MHPPKLNLTRYENVVLRPACDALHRVSVSLRAARPAALPHIIHSFLALVVLI